MRQSDASPAYCIRNTTCLPFSYCTTLQSGFKIEYCRWGSGEPYICCPKIMEEVCGRPSAKSSQLIGEWKMKEAVVGGSSVASAQSSPWMVALGEKVEQDVEWFCGGCLVSRDRVLTAAHCIKRRRVDIIRAGELDFSLQDDSASPIDVRVVDVIAHPQYKPPSAYNDIAILKLAYRLQFNAYMKHICLPEMHSAKLYDGVHATLTGWGRMAFGGEKSSVLQKVSVVVYSNSNCNFSFSRPAVYNIRLPSGIVDSLLCAGDPSGEKDACQGDSGGPLVVANEEGIHTLIGIVSSGRGCGSKMFPGIYTRVSSFSDWIRSYL